MKKGDETRALHLPAALYSRIQERVAAAGFKTVDEYVAFVLEEVLKDEEEEARTNVSQAEEQEVKRRLKALGYLR